jgi:hypothetical protein
MPLRLSFGRKFSLRTLLAAVSLICVGLAVWAYVPDPNNTLPMARIVPPDLLAPIKGATQPQIIWLGEEPAVDSSGHHRYWVAIVNPTSHTLHYHGYTMDSWSQRPPWGEIYPFYAPEHQTAAGWTPDQLARCGTGAGDLAIKPGHAGKFDVYDHDGNLPFRVRVGYTLTKGGAPSGRGVLVSEPCPGDGT